MSKLTQAIRARLIAEWRHAWRYWSVRLNGLGLVLLSACQIVTEAWNSMPADLRHVVPYAQGISLALFAGGLVARFVAQPKTQEKIDGRCK